MVVEELIFSSFLFMPSLRTYRISFFRESCPSSFIPIHVLFLHYDLIPRSLLLHLLLRNREHAKATFRLNLHAWHPSADTASAEALPPPEPGPSAAAEALALGIREAAAAGPFGGRD